MTDIGVHRIQRAANRAGLQRRHRPVVGLQFTFSALQDKSAEPAKKFRIGIIVSQFGYSRNAAGA
jgi:hypothetical protein